MAASLVSAADEKTFNLDALYLSYGGHEQYRHSVLRTGSPLSAQTLETGIFRQPSQPWISTYAKDSDSSQYILLSARRRSDDNCKCCLTRIKEQTTSSQVFPNQGTPAFALEGDSISQPDVLTCSSSHSWAKRP